MPKYEMPGWLRHWINNREANARAEIDRFDRVRDEARREANRVAREFEVSNQQATRRRREWF